MGMARDEAMSQQRWLAAGIYGAILLAGGPDVSGQTETPSVKQAPELAAGVLPRRDPLRGEKLAFFGERLKAAPLTVGEQAAPGQFVPEPLIQFENPISSIEDGFMFLWTDGVRPLAVVKSYHNIPSRSWGRTFVS